MTILIIGDQSVNRQILCAILAPIVRNREIKPFSCPNEALNWAQTNAVTHVLSKPVDHGECQALCSMQIENSTAPASG